MLATEAYGPSVGGLEGDPSVRVTSNMSALDGPTETVRNAAVVLAHPSTVSGALTAILFTRPLALKPLR